MAKKYYGFSFLVVVAFVGLAVFWPPERLTPQPAQEVKGEAVLSLPVAAAVPKLKSETQNHETNAEIAFVVDLGTGKVLFDKNAGKPWPPASFNKILAAVVSVNLVSGNETIVVGEDDLKVASPKMDLYEGEKITVDALLAGMLVSSANDAMTTLARGVAGSVSRYTELMNLMAVRLGMNDTSVKNPWGFDQEGQYTTAFDVMLVTKEFLRHRELASIVSKKNISVYSTDGKTRHQLTSTNQLIGLENVFGIKTGYTDEAKGNLVVLFQTENNKNILSIIMGSSDRETDSSALMNWILLSYIF